VGCIRPVRLTRGALEVPAGAVWGDTFLVVPGSAAGQEWTNELTGERVRVVEREGEPGVWAREALATLPLAVLMFAPAAAPGSDRGGEQRAKAGGE
jgi:hypothetical protein